MAYRQSSENISDTFLVIFLENRNFAAINIKKMRGKEHNKVNSPKRKRLAKVLRWTIPPLAICLIGIIICNYIVNAAAKGRTFSQAANVTHRHYALLLGTNPKSKNGRINSFYFNRIEATVRLYQAGKFDHLIISGAADDEGYDEPQSMRADLMARGVPDSIMTLDGKGFRTINSIERAKNDFGVDSMIVISQEFHNKRAIYQAQHYGIDAIGFNADDSPFLYWRVKNHLREYLARVKVVFEMAGK